jgi:crotonobetainyl-CoA:carnitine CoA-transferase CaiB-like acyl-CoA transferase
MFESLTAFALLEHMWGRTFVPPRGEARYPRQASPGRRPYQTADGWIAILLLTDRHWSRFFDLIGRPELAADERYADVSARNQNLDSLFALLDEMLRQQPTAHWLKVLPDAGIPAGPYNRIDDLFDDPQLEAMDFFQHFDHPTEGELLYFVTPLTFDGERPDLGPAARQLGEDSDSLLSAPAD